MINQFMTVCTTEYSNWCSMTYSNNCYSSETDDATVGHSLRKVKSNKISGYDIIVSAYSES